MATHSIARRVMALFVLAEVLMALAMTGFVFVYERHTHFHSFDVALHGRAEMLLGAVVDAEDTEDRVVLDMEGIHLPEHDVYEVWDNGQTLLGRTVGWSAPAALRASSRNGEHIEVRGRDYRAVRVSGLRRVDPDASSVLHSIVVYYAAPVWPVWTPVLDAVRAFALASAVLVALSSLLVMIFLRRSMQPLQLLASQAAAISSSHWKFAPPEHARQTRELAPLTLALEDLVARLQIAFTQQRKFVSDSAHELKTAITVIKSSLQLLELRPRNAEEYQAGVTTSLEDCGRMEELVQRMLTLARVEEGDATSFERPMPIDLDAGIRTALAFVAPLGAVREVRFEYQEGARLYAAILPDDWTMLIGNLLTNALQHSPAGSRIRVVLKQDGASAVCRVIDRGYGIDPETLPRIFDRFYRGDPSRARATGGSGLGLAICKAVAERCSGQILIQSSLGVGTTAIVKLPVVEAVIATAAAEASLEAWVATASG